MSQGDDKGLRGHQRESRLAIGDRSRLAHGGSRKLENCVANGLASVRGVFSQVLLLEDALSCIPLGSDLGASEPLEGVNTWVCRAPDPS